MNAGYEWGGFPMDDDNDLEEVTQQEAHDWAKNVMNDSLWDQQKEGGR